MNHARISGLLLIITGCLHTLIGVVDGVPLLAAMVGEGLVGTATASLERQMLLWFLVCAAALILIGMLAFGYDRVLPASFDWGLLLLSVVGALVLDRPDFCSSSRRLSTFSS